MVLLNLPIKDLLVNAQRVCKKWNSVINTSPELQRALFFSPVAGKPLRLFYNGVSRGWAESQSDPYAYTMLANPFYDILAGYKFSFEDLPED